MLIVHTGGPQTVLEAVTWRRLLVSGWPWRSAGYLLTGLPPAAVAFAVLAIPWLVLVTQLAAGRYQLGTIVLLILLGAALAGGLKDRVVEVEDFIDALRRVVAGGTVVDPQVISQLVRRRRDPLSSLSTREREVLALIAEGHSNTAIARRLVVTEAAVGKHVHSILAKLRLPQTDDTNRRVLAVLAYLRVDNEEG